MSDPGAPPDLERRPARHSDRRVVMVVSAGEELSLADVVTNLATVCAEVGQRVALVSTAGLASPPGDAELPAPAPLPWTGWPTPGNGAGPSLEEERVRLQTGPLKPADVEPLLGETGVAGVSRLDLRYFVGHPAQVVVRVPEVVAALRATVDVVFLEVPSFLTVHHGAALTPLADVVVVVGERETTTVGQTRQLSAALRHLAASVVGMVLTDGGLEFYDWGPVDAELETADRPPRHALDPTEQIPIPESAAAAPEAPFTGFSVVEQVQRDA